MAQQVEHVLGKDEVTGSNPVISSRIGTFGITDVPFYFRKVFCSEARERITGMSPATRRKIRTKRNKCTSRQGDAICRKT